MGILCHSPSWELGIQHLLGEKSTTFATILSIQSYRSETPLCDMSLSLKFSTIVPGAGICAWIGLTLTSIKQVVIRIAISWWEESDIFITARLGSSQMPKRCEQCSLHFQCILTTCCSIRTVSRVHSVYAVYIDMYTSLAYDGSVKKLWYKQFMPAALIHLSFA